jgi:hypothetical protein
MSDEPKVTGGQDWELLQKARSRLRYLAHRYSGCKKKDKFTRDRAAEEMEEAAIVFALAAAAYGAKSDCARPAGQVGLEWKEGLEPETLLDSEPERYLRDKAQRDDVRPPPTVRR